MFNKFILLISWANPWTPWNLRKNHICEKEYDYFKKNPELNLLEEVEGFKISLKSLFIANGIDQTIEEQYRYKNKPIRVELDF